MYKTISLQLSIRGLIPFLFVSRSSPSLVLLLSLRLQDVQREHPYLVPDFSKNSLRFSLVGCCLWAAVRCLYFVGLYLLYSWILWNIYDERMSDFVTGLLCI